jgi:copper chaperone CopZ
MLKMAQLLLSMFLKRSTGTDESSDLGRSPLLRMRYPIRTVHLLPGRVRFYAPVLVGRSEDGERVRGALRRIQGVISVDIDARSGTVLILFDNNRLEAEILFAALIRLLGLEKELNKTPKALLRKEGWIALQSLNRGVYDSTNGLIDLYSAAGILAGAAAVNHLVIRHLSLPGMLMSTWLFLNTRGKH